MRDPGDIGARESDITLTFLTPAFRDAFSRQEVGTISEGTHDRPGRRAHAGRGRRRRRRRRRRDRLEPGDRVGVPAGHPDDAQHRDGAADSSRSSPGWRDSSRSARQPRRLQDAAAGDDPTLGALGATRTDRWARLAAPSVLAVRGRHRARTGARRGGVPALPDRAGPPRRPRSRVPRRLRHPGARWSGVGRPAGRARRGRGPLACAPHRRGRRATVRVSRWGRIAAELGTPAPAVTGLTLASGTPGRPGPHRRRRHHAQRDGGARGLRLQRQRRPPARRTRPVRVGLRRGDRGRGSRTDRAIPTLPPGLETDPDVLDLSTLYTQIPITLDGTPTVRHRGHRASRVARSGDGPRRRTAGRGRAGGRRRHAGVDRRARRRHDRRLAR